MVPRANDPEYATEKDCRNRGRVATILSSSSLGMMAILVIVCGYSAYLSDRAMQIVQQHITESNVESHASDVRTTMSESKAEARSAIQDQIILRLDQVRSDWNRDITLMRSENKDLLSSLKTDLAAIREEMRQLHAEISKGSQPK